MTAPTPITVAHGDGIGPEIMAATLQIIQEAGARLAIQTVEIGEKQYLKGNLAGIEPSAFESLRSTRVFLKAPITTPQGGGYKSLNVTTRKAFGLYANIRPCLSYDPFVRTKHPNMDVVIVRENEEDTYAGIEHRQSIDVMQCLKLITRPGTEKIVRYAFEYARAYGRKKVTCFSKDNIMKLTDGLFHKVFDEIGAEYPDIEQEHWIVDIGAAKLADTPEVFDVIVMPNLYGDILSDVAAQIAGSVGLAGSANIGDGCAMFEAIHGSAPRRAGQNLANPSGLFLGAIQMLVHIGQAEIAQLAHNAWLKTMEDGVHTYDIFKEGISKEKVGTKEFALAVVARIGKSPEILKRVDYSRAPKRSLTERPPYVRSQEKKEFIGADIFIEWLGKPDALAAKLLPLEGDGLTLQSLSNRGAKVWPGGMDSTFTVDVTRCRFALPENVPGAVSHKVVTALLDRITDAGLEFVKLEGLYLFDGKPGFPRGEGQ